MSTTIHAEPIGKTAKGKQITAYTLDNENGLRATFIDFGATLIELEVPDRIGIPDDITLGFDSIEKYIEENKPYFGVIVGRYANRIAGAKFSIGNKTFQLDANENKNHIHGGSKGLSSKLWKGKVVEGDTGEELLLSVKSPNGEMGFPGKVEVIVKISLNDKNGLVYDYEATTDADTHINLTTHPYFNLISQDAGSIRNHHVQIVSDQYVANQKGGIPTGKFNPVEDGPFDFRELDVLDHRLDSPDKQIISRNGFDHTFVLDPKRDIEKPVATVVEESSGRKLEVFTSEPGIHFYTGNSLDGSLEGKSGQAMEKHHGFCLETQHFPDSPNQPSFPNTLIKANKKFKSHTEYRFSKIE